MAEKEMKIILAHPGRQHSFRLASALEKCGFLHSYVTTVYYRENSIMMNLLNLFLSKNNRERAKNRKMEDVPDSKVVLFNQINGLIILLLLRIDKTKKVYHWFNDFSKKRFEIKLAKYAVKNNVDVVICYSGHGYFCFKYLHEKAPYILRVSDVPSANKNYLKYVYEKDFIKNKEFRTELFNEVSFIWNLKYMAKYNTENTLINRFLVPSDFVRKSFMFDGIDEKKMSFLPYGSNLNNSYIPNKTIGSKLNLIYVGNVTQIKGLSYLFEAISKIPEDLAELNVYGTYNKKSVLFKKYFQRVNFHGFVTKKEINKALLNADVFIFPSLGEGMSLSIIEAMSQSLPVIISENSGISEYVEDYQNGFTVEIQNSEQIKEKILWFVDNKDKINLMGKNAFETSKIFTWKRYDENVRVLFNGLIK